MARRRLGEERGVHRKRDVASPADDRKDVNRAARVLEILASFTVEDRYLGNLEIAERTAIPRPTVSRITATLVEMGYLNYDNRIGKYEVGPRVLALSYSLMARLQISTKARPLMEQLARESQAIVGLGILDGLNVVFIETAMGDLRYSQRVMVGFRVPVALTAIGWSCLSVLNSPERTEVMKKVEALYPAEISKIASNVKQAVADIWTRGFCISEGALDPSSNTVGVPFLDSDGRQILAFNMIASVNVLTRQSLETKWGPRLVKLAEQLRQGDSFTPAAATVASDRGSR